MEVSLSIHLKLSLNGSMAKDAIRRRLKRKPST
jgi:hypothetical protein